MQTVVLHQDLAPALEEFVNNKYLIANNNIKLKKWRGPTFITQCDTNEVKTSYILFLLINSKTKQAQIYQESPDGLVSQKGNFQKGLK